MQGFILELKPSNPYRLGQRRKYWECAVEPEVPTTTRYKINAGIRVQTTPIE